MYHAVLVNLLLNTNSNNQSYQALFFSFHRDCTCQVMISDLTPSSSNGGLKRKLQEIGEDSEGMLVLSLLLFLGMIVSET